MHKTLRLAFIIGFAICAPMAAQAETEEQVSKQEKLPFGYVRSHDAAMSGNSTADHLALAAQYMVANEYYDRAIAVCQKALRKNGEDCDIHKIYAEALEGKLKKEKKDNPDLYMECLKEWLIVLRNERGDEKGISFRGVGIPGVMKAFEDEDHQLEAKGHLVDITGISPRPWETDTMFLKRASKQSSTAVSGRLLEKNFEASPHAVDMGSPTPKSSQSPSADAQPKSTEALDWLKQ
jgi:hypothetical protein